MHVFSATLESDCLIRAVCSEPPVGFRLSDVLLAPAAEVLRLHVEEDALLIETGPLQAHKNYSLLLRGAGMTPVDPGPWLHRQQPEGHLGCRIENDTNVFRLFAPRASSVRLLLYDAVGDSVGDSWVMQRRADGVWEAAIPLDQSERYYAFSIDGPRGEGELFNPRIPVADPYAHAVVSMNTFRHETKAVVPAALPAYDWEGDSFVSVAVEDLIIYEMHVRDMTAHASSGVAQELAGSYKGLTAEGVRGGLDHLRTLGINAVELMPCQQFAWMEPPYLRHVGEFYNHWNPWETNHWGYMTSYYFTPEPRYASAANLEDGMWNDVALRHLTEFRDMIKALHREGLAVILDVVFNHSSQYDWQPLKYIDRKYYYHLDRHGQYISKSGCGNDLYTTRPAVRKLIVESILHWMREYHIDGFRFDLGAMIDDETLLQVRDEARRINPDVILITEPWGGGRYDPAGFSRKEYASWNDIFRNGVKGSDPLNHTGYIFGHWGGASPEDFGMWMLGCVRSKSGPFLSHAHSVNYLESHDGYTLADFIRIASGTARAGQRIEDVVLYRRLTDTPLAISRLAALMLLTSRGAVMLHAGQEFGRGKLIADRGIPDVVPHVIDHNSYEKDDETNWLDYTFADANQELLEYYRGLIAIRGEHPVLRRSADSRYQFLAADVPIAGGFEILDESGEPLLVVLINANHEQPARYDLRRKREWEVLADDNQASATALRTLDAQHVVVPPCSGMILRFTTYD
jgi:pullulanase